MDIKKYENMVKLNLPEDERLQIARRADELFESFKALEGIDASGAQPLVSVLESQNVLREDIAVKAITREELMQNAPEQYDGYFQVPKTVD